MPPCILTRPSRGNHSHYNPLTLRSSRPRNPLPLKGGATLPSPLEGKGQGGGGNHPSPKDSRLSTLPQGEGDWTVERSRAYFDRMDPEIADLFPDRFVSSELGQIPEKWEVKTLGELCHKPQYGYTASAKNEPVGPKFLRITDINKTAWINWDTVPHCQMTDKDFDKYRLAKGDVLITRMADPGHGVMVEENQEAVFASYLIRFCPKHEQYARLLQYWLRSDHYWKLVKERGAGTTRASLNAKVLSGFPFVVPSAMAATVFSNQISGLRNRVVGNTAETKLLAAQRDALLPKLVRVRDATDYD